VAGRAIRASVFLVVLLAAPSGSAQSQDAHLTARPGSVGQACESGQHTLKLGPGRTAVMRVTPGSGARKALFLVLHGSGGSSQDGIWAFRAALRHPDVVLVAPSSESRNWNPFYGSDLNSIDRALRRAFSRCSIDPRRIVIGGFSDGAGNALTIGLLNGDLFRSVVAFSPGGYVAARPRGRPRIYVAHGAGDSVIPLRQARRIVRQLRSDDYTVAFRTFAGGHDVPLGVSQAAVQWALRPGQR
jgi:predicted esterase